MIVSILKTSSFIAFVLMTSSFSLTTTTSTTNALRQVASSHAYYPVDIDYDEYDPYTRLQQVHQSTVNDAYNSDSEYAQDVDNDDEYAATATIDSAEMHGRRNDHGSQPSNEGPLRSHIRGLQESHAALSGPSATNVIMLNAMPNTLLRQTIIDDVHNHPMRVSNRYGVVNYHNVLYVYIKDDGTFVTDKHGHYVIYDEQEVSTMVTLQPNTHLRACLEHEPNRPEHRALTNPRLTLTSENINEWRDDAGRIVQQNELYYPLHDPYTPHHY